MGDRTVEENDDAQRQRGATLEERMATIDQQREALLHEVRSPLTSQDRREEVFAWRLKLMAEWTLLEEELRTLRDDKAS